MTSFANRVEQISISGIRKVFEAAGEDAINLGLGQPDFPSPPHVRTAARDAIASGAVDGYTTNKGLRSLREAIAETYDERYDLAVDPSAIIATAGASEALHLAIQAHVEPGDEVLIPDPGFVSYEALTRVAGGTPRPIGLRDDLTLAPGAVEAAITDDTAAFVVNSPANPTGAVQSRDDMEAFARIADQYDVLCLTDEVYERIVFEGTHHSPVTFANSDNVVIVSACSKTYSMTGWRLGWVIASERRIERMLRIHQYAQACASAPAQYAAEAALRGPQTPVDDMVAQFKVRRDLVLDGLASAGLSTPTPNGAFYVLPTVPDGWVEAVIEAGVIVVPGEAFGERGLGTARLSYATGTEELKVALETIQDVTDAIA